MDKTMGLIFGFFEREQDKIKGIKVAGITNSISKHTKT